MSLQDCMDYFQILIDYIRNYFHSDEIYTYASSFGRYLVLKYIAEYGNPFVKIALRCPAVNMAQVLVNSIMKRGEFATLNKGKTVQVGFDRKIDINRQFLKDLENSDMQFVDFTPFAYRNAA